MVDKKEEHVCCSQRILIMLENFSEGIYVDIVVFPAINNKISFFCKHTKWPIFPEIVTSQPQYYPIC